jgi:hypothetical protein
MQEIQAFQTPDNRTFFVQKEAQIHQCALDNEETIDRFCEINEIPERSRASLKRTIPMFLAFVESEETTQELLDFVSKSADAQNWPTQAA